jgi:hypothetical protein
MLFKCLSKKRLLLHTSFFKFGHIKISMGLCMAGKMADEKIKLWFVYEGVTKEDKCGILTKKIIKIINQLEKTYNKEMFDLRAIELARFLSESKKARRIKKSDLPVVFIDDEPVFKSRLPSVLELKKEIEKRCRGESRIE